MIKKIKKFIISTPLHKTILKIKAARISNSWVRENNKILGHKTIYCISPYKTGTTYLASSFDDSISQHESLHYTSMKKLNEDFERYFIRRLNTLNLKLECSGFLSSYVDDLAQNKISKDLTYICVLRKPSAWVTSAVNHHQIVKGANQHYFWGNELYWKEHVGVDLGNFLLLNDDEKLAAAKKMTEFYMSFTKKTKQLKNVKYVWIKDLQEFLPKLEKMIDEEAKPEKSEKNKASLKKYTYKNDEIDLAYEKLVDELLTNN
ncbi:hypothetical protein [Flagellimonas zhangzhouensis]|uniref:Sulfotransferase family protein n=1 Tax=Flagellimonas zhangzhouensis TaxID=1073328 RepID=A0A1H2YQH1_9FLAO|nr:hypothetical protein [Allomuricauda zhangzhouensis]SDR00396.1 hypothetical protein SAMN05216294_3096 [Allomuricauda zhangzhouensis]SDX07426.1 hypothetical protein SAMN04487892_3167 [Allomuricauda zhangzhouensis]